MLSLSPELLAITVVLFLFMVYLLNIILYKPIFIFLSSRDNISSDYENKIKALSQKIDSCSLESKELLIKAREEAKQIREEKIKAVDLKIEQEIVIYKRQLVSLQTTKLKLLEDEKKSVLKDLQNKLPEYTKLVTSKIS